MDIGEQITEIVAAGVLLLVAAVILSQLVAIGGGGPAQTDASLLGDDVPGGIVDLNNVEESLGTQYSFDGSGSLSGDIPDPDQGDSELCTYASVESGATGTNQTIANADGELAIQYHGNRTTPQWVGYRYNESSRSAADASVPAPSPTSRTHVCVREDSGDILINASGNESGSQIANTRPDTFDADASALAGDLEETRLYPTALNTSQRTTLRDEPTAPVSGARPTARIMYDSRLSTGSAVDTAEVRFAGTTATVSGATVADGLAGRAVSAADVQINEDRNRLTATEGGPLDGAPVAFIDYEAGGFGYQTIQLIETAFQFAPVLLIVSISVYILSKVRAVRP